MRVLVFGGRNFGAIPYDTLDADMVSAIRRARMQAELLYSVLDKLHKERPITVVINGKARGADTVAGEWARSRRIPVEEYPADWKKHNRAAGPLRNGRMVSEGLPDMAVACPGSAGTADMLQRLRSAGIEVIHVG